MILDVIEQLGILEVAAKTRSLQVRLELDMTRPPHHVAGQGAIVPGPHANGGHGQIHSLIQPQQAVGPAAGCQQVLQCARRRTYV